MPFEGDIIFEEQFPNEYTDSSYIHPTAIVYPNVKLGRNVYIGAYSVIGGPPEHKEYWDGEYSCVIIEDSVRISNHVTIDSGCTRPTRISKGSIILSHAHIGHDVYIGDCVTISCGAKIGGHCIIGHNCNIGLNASIHQFKTIPTGCMIGANAFVGKTLVMEPNSKYVGVPARYLSPNIKK